MRGRLWFLAFALLAVGNACKCGRASVLSKASHLDVSPNPVLFPPLPVGKGETIAVQVRNTGNQDLHLSRNPWIVETDGDGLEEYTLRTILALDCGGTPRADGSRLVIVPGDCAQLVVRYAPLNTTDKDPAELNFASDDPDHPTLAIPMGLGDPAHLQVCTIKSDGSDDACDSVDSQPPQIDFGMVAKGQSTLKKVRLRNVGKSQLTNMVVYDPAGPARDDFARSANAPTALDPNQSFDLTVRFTPSGGGERSGFLQVDSTDPARPTVQVPMRGIAQGPALCADPNPLDFGQTDVGHAVDKQLILSSCGSAPVRLQQVAFDALSSPAFTAQSLPGPQTMQVGDKLTVNLHYLPQDTGDSQGALLVPNDGQPDQYVVLHGTAKMETSCRLGASTSKLDFGQVVRGQSAQRDLSVANRGSLDCHLSAVKIAAGGSYFSVVQPPATTVMLKPGDTFTATAQYAPFANDANPSDSGAIEFDSDDPLNPQLQVPLTGIAVAQAACKIDVHPEPQVVFPNPIADRVLVFGNVSVSKTKTLPVTFTNKGSASCTLSNWKLQLANASCFPPIIPCPPCSNGDCKGYFVANPGSTTLLPGASTLMNVTFAPRDTSQSPFISDVVLYTETSDASLPSECHKTMVPDDTQGCVSVSMSGQGDLSNLEVIPADLDFGLVTMGCKSKTQNVTLYNTGATTSFTIKSINLDPSTAPFYLQAPPTPFNMGPGAKVPLQVTYKPSQAAKEAASLRIESDASNTTSNNPYVTVGLSGTGTTDKHQRDTFTQATVPRVDVLFVIDDSGSFNFYQNDLAQQATNFINAALRYNADYHIGVSANDVVERKTDGNASYDTTIYVGGLYGQPPIVTNSTPNPADAFSKNVKIGTGGTAQREAGLELARDVLSAPANQKAPPQGSQGFLRDDARLVVIDVQDDDDESNGTTDYYIDFFKSLKGQYNAGLVSFNAIGSFDEQTGQPKQCIPNSSEPGGFRYYKVAQASGGKTWSICNADWGAIADQLALGAFAGRKQFALSRYADPATIAVTLNGAAQNNPADYIYDAASNSIIFASVPAPGAVIVANYDALCF
jgi:hypothetical protein